MSDDSIHICQGRWCSELGAARILDRVRSFFGNKVEVVGCQCLGYCEEGVNAMKQGRVYHNLTEENAVEALQGAGRERRMDPVDIVDDFLGDL